jgi:hypothetical protein
MQHGIRMEGLFVVSSQDGMGRPGVRREVDIRTTGREGRRSIAGSPILVFWNLIMATDAARWICPMRVGTSSQLRRQKRTYPKSMHTTECLRINDFSTLLY